LINRRFYWLSAFPLGGFTRSWRITRSFVMNKQLNHYRIFSVHATPHRNKSLLGFCASDAGTYISSCATHFVHIVWRLEDRQLPVCRDLLLPVLWECYRMLRPSSIREQLLTLRRPSYPMGGIDTSNSIRNAFATNDNPLELRIPTRRFPITKQFFRSIAIRVMSLPTYVVRDR
jgi:hypothetical protein